MPSPFCVHRDSHCRGRELTDFEMMPGRFQANLDVRHGSHKPAVERFATRMEGCRPGSTLVEHCLHGCLAMLSQLCCFCRELKKFD